jgi:AcrR family transcriptional regulator
VCTVGDVADGRLARGDQTRRTVLDAAVSAASVDGLDGMSLSRLAGAVHVSKSGLFAHWPDKQTLQVEIIEHAGRQWAERIVEPALREEGPLRRLWALHERRLAFYSAHVLPGGCFFAAVEPEFDDCPGPVRDAIASAIQEWTQLLQRLARSAVKHGELERETDPDQLVFEIQSLGKAVVTHAHLTRDAHAYAFARRGVLDRLRALATDPSMLPEE